MPAFRGFLESQHQLNALQQVHIIYVLKCNSEAFATAEIAYPLGHTAAYADCFCRYI